MYIYEYTHKKLHTLDVNLPELAYCTNLQSQNKGNHFKVILEWGHVTSQSNSSTFHCE